MPSMRFILGALLCFFVIKLPLTDSNLEIAFVVASVLVGVFNLFIEEKHIISDITGSLGFIVMFILISNYSIYETIAFTILSLSHLLKIVKKLTEVTP